MIQQAEETALREKDKYKNVKSQTWTGVESRRSKVSMLSDQKRLRPSSGSSCLDDDELAELQPLISVLKQDIIAKNIQAADKLQELANGQSILEWTEERSG